MPLRQLLPDVCPLSSSMLILVEHNDALYRMTVDQARGYQAYLSANVKAHSERMLMTREMREAAERDKASKRAFTQVKIHSVVVNPSVM